LQIAFIHPGKSFLPGIQAYCNFFSTYGVETKVVLKKNLKAIQPDVEWHFMGTHIKKKHASAIVIHEYASASIPPFTKFKNAIKRKLNVQPDYRIFLNEFVKEKFAFEDSIPFGYRDLGISKDFLDAPYWQTTDGIEKEFDFIYSGSTSKELNIQKLLNHFSAQFKDKSILILSKNYQHLREKYKEQRNICFEGPVPQSQVPKYLLKSRFAINYKPNIEPHNRQTVTKLIEYAACKIPVITSDFAWVRQFHKQYGGEYFYLKDDLSNFTWKNINQFEYSFPDLSALTWESQIKKSGVLDFLSSKFPELHWKI
jgi:glycosyltransferase involved in cell wall biosynthesis